MSSSLSTYQDLERIYQDSEDDDDLHDALAGVLAMLWRKRITNEERTWLNGRLSRDGILKLVRDVVEPEGYRAEWYNGNGDFSGRDWTVNIHGVALKLIRKLSPIRRQINKTNQVTLVTVLLR